MDTASLKSFATSVRTELIREIGARIAAVLAHGSPERVEQPQAVIALERAITAGGGDEEGKTHLADKVAYTWFNRIIALRFMDANGYTGIGVVSPAADQVGQPEVLAAAKRGQVDSDVVKGVNATAIKGLLNGTRQPRPGVDAQSEAYNLLLTEYCRYWNKAMPFMFEREGDYTELLIPANLLADDSILSRSVKVLTQEVCQDVEVIGWLYQFYISERKDEVFAGFRKNKKAGPEEIPAATQLFTPHWIVRYLVENTVGRLWMLNHPESRLVDQMDYYIAPVDEEANFLQISKPEELTVVDPACGSGHMLTYAFDLLYSIYEEEGYAPSQIPSLILTNNLYGIEIDPRAGALAAFALTMKAVAKRKLFLKNPVEPQVCVLEPVSFTADELSYLVSRDGDRQEEDIFWNQFTEVDTFGSLLQPDAALTGRLAKHIMTLDGDDLLLADILNRAQQAISQATYLTREYAAVVANPPYMGSKNMGALMSEWLRARQKTGKMDLYAAFIERAMGFGLDSALVGMVTMHGWLFLTSYNELRTKLRHHWSVVTLAHLGTGAFEEQSGEVVSAAAFVLRKYESDTPGAYFRLTDVPKSTKRDIAKSAFRNPRDPRRFNVKLHDLDVVPGGGLAYWLTDEDLAAFATLPTIGSMTDTRSGMATGDNERFLRYWWEVSWCAIGFGLGSATESVRAGVTWVPYNKGGRARRWYGNNELVVNWRNDGELIKRTKADNLRAGRITANNSKVWNQDRFFMPSVTWSAIGSGRLATRYSEQGSIFDTKGQCLFVDDEDLRYYYLALLNSGPVNRFLEALSPTLDFNSGSIAKVPDPRSRVDLQSVAQLARKAVMIQKSSWDRDEVSWDFSGFPKRDEGKLEEWALTESAAWTDRTRALEAVEEEIDHLVLNAYGLQVESDIAPVEALQQSENSIVRDLVSYSVGCMFGRYSLNEPGLILADQGAKLHDYLAKVPVAKFMPDTDNVIPILDGDWFEDDIVERFRHFLRVAFGEQYFEENLQFVTKSLGVKRLRDYFSKSFYKDHVKRYKKRPIYWLFSSPKGSFNALIYMHRYTPSTVSTVLTYLREYVNKLESALQQAERAGNAKEADRLRKMLVELNEYEHDTLFPKASENIVIDLDDGVKVNYPKFGAALKKIRGLE